MYDVVQSRIAQKKYVEERNYPHFAPRSGICYSCNENIYEKLSWKRENGRRIQVPNDSEEVMFTSGITVEKASSGLVTGCPHCNRSYCD